MNTKAPVTNPLLAGIEMPDTEDGDVYTTSSVAGAEVPSSVRALATQLSAKHGPVTIAAESSGYHLYMADPELLLTDGEKELNSKHLAVNASKYLGIDDFDIDLKPTKANAALYKKRTSGDEIPCAMCMKTQRPYTVEYLLTCKPLADRAPQFASVLHAVNTIDNRKRLVYDENGNLVPEGPGKICEIHKLHRDHPAIVYLVHRGFLPALLYKQFRCSYCYEEMPENRAEGRYYGRLINGMKNSPGGRIIFEVRMFGVRQGWQARYIDRIEGGVYSVWSGEEKWEPIRAHLPDGSWKQFFNPTPRFPKGFDPHKYMNAPGSKRNELLMGLDAALEYNASRPLPMRYCYLVEGPLDAAKLREPAIALLGKSMSPQQAQIVRANFSKVFVVMDNDEAGQQCLRKIQTVLGMSVTEVLLDTTHKDIGELSYVEAAALVKPYLEREGLLPC